MYHLNGIVNMFSELQETICSFKRSWEKKIFYTSDGTYTQFVDDIAECGVNGFVLEPTTDMEYIAEKYGKTHCFIGNADTRILLNGSKDDIFREVKRCVDIGKKLSWIF